MTARIFIFADFDRVSSLSLSCLYFISSIDARRNDASIAAVIRESGAVLQRGLLLQGQPSASTASAALHMPHLVLEWAGFTPQPPGQGREELLW